MSLMILAQVYFVSRYAGTSITPASIYGSFWFLFTFIPLILVPSAPASVLAMGYIFLSCIVISLSSVVVKWPEAMRINSEFGRRAVDAFNTEFLNVTFYVVSFLAIVCWALNVQVQGITLSRIWQEFFTVSNEYIMNRYNETLINSVYSQLSNVFSYTSAALGGMIISRLQDRFRILVLVVLSFLPSVLVLTVQGAKGMIFLSMSLFYGGWLIRRMKSGEITLLDRGVIKKSLLYALVLLPLVTISFVARGIYALEDTSEILFALQKYYISYSSVHLYAFSDWFNYYVGAPYTQFYSDSLLETTNGFYTFMAIFRLFGDDRYVPPGVFTEYYGYGNFLSGNIYTYFRGLILDFGIFGSLVFLFICGILCNISIKAILVSKYPTFSVAIFISMMGFIYTTFIISLLIWNSIFGILILLPFILFINQLLIIRADSAVAMGR